MIKTKKYFLWIVAGLLLIISGYQLTLDNIFNLSNIYTTEGFNFGYLLLLVIPFSQCILLYFLWKTKKVGYAIFGLLIVIPFGVSESKEILEKIELNNNYRQYAQGILHKHNFSTQEKTLSVNQSNLSSAIDLAAKYLLNSVQDDGRFQYKRNLNPHYDNYGSEYNILRHAGSIYSLVNYFKFSNQNLDTTSLLRAADWLKSTIVNIDPDKIIKAVWSPSENEDTDYDHAKLGGTALTLIALLEIEKLKPGFTNSSIITSLGNFLLYMQKNNGEFYSRYIRRYGGRTELNPSLFYPGQAILALTYLYEYNNDTKWLKSATGGLKFLIESRKEVDELPPDHWVLIATNKYLNYINLDTIGLKYEEILEHSKRICESFIRHYEEKDEGSNFYGCFTNDGLTCYTASSIEGISSAIQFLPENENVFKKLLNNIISEGISFLFDSQVPSGELKGGIPHAKEPWKINHINEMEKAGEIRIDYVQHSLSAMLNYNEIITK